ncbi:myotubularin-related protein 14 isoform X2 [Frieseomelitta varia]|uniref:myotubularin-related protein 14 isoform X2 n=1 Tax=Frieseomelitta varia TaxID=561572 RepID=UPI001CB69E2C|nr:myotubularin-related protein 14 isoform X2 [Frieseomelitta varia]
MDTTVCEIISPEPAQIMISELKELIIYFSKHTYRATVADNVSQDIIQKCLSLIDVDYKYSIIYNNTGDICSHYPTHLIILEEEKIDKYRDAEVIDVPLSLSCTEDVTDKFANINKLKDLIKKANAARCRSRFPLPVIMYKGRHICRSATLSGGAEIYTKRGLDYFLSTSEDISEQVDETEEKVDETKQEIDETELSESSSQPSQWNLFDKVRNKDIKLLKTFNVGIIIDFMVEKKKVKYGFHVSSSEKVDKFGRYSDFSIISLPYPGCEFFKGFRENDYVGDNLIFDWSQAWVDAEINVPEDRISSQLQIDWDQYQQWDILVLTQNYLKLILRYLSQSSNGMLIHCISGWDRTPLFISLLRLSLWADNVIHKSLNPYQMLYYTIAYDWMLFGHDLQDRLSKGEEIFFFCFYFLKYICDEDFSIKQDFYQCDSKSDDDEIKHPIFDMEPVTEDPSISASGSDSNKNSRASRDSKDSQNKYSSADIISTNSPPKTEEFGDSIKHDLEFETIFPMELETEDQSPFLKLINSNKNSRDDQDEPLPKMVWTWNISPSKLKDFSFTKPPSLSSSLFEEEITHELVVSHDQTPPVVVPGSRQRTKSTTSAGSWEVVTETGSLTDSATTTGQPLIEQPTIEPSISTRKLKERESVTHNRKDRLCFLRNTFYTVYSQIGFQMKENSTPGNLKQMFQTFTGMFSSESTTL